MKNKNYKPEENKPENKHHHHKSGHTKKRLQHIRDIFFKIFSLGKSAPFLICIVAPQFITSQTFTNTTGGPIPDNGAQVFFPITVSGLSPTTINTTFGLESVCFNINHTADADLYIYLYAPDGTIVPLSIANGGMGNDYTNTCLNGGATTLIKAGSPPFSGSFRPEGFIGANNNGQVGNGIWQLSVQDIGVLDSGSVLSWSITFGNNPSLPFGFTSSDLPIVVLSTNNQVIQNYGNLNAHMGIIDNGAGVRNYMTDAFNTYNNKIGIQLRGSTSLYFPQKSYALETRNNANIKNDTIMMGMPAEHDWILYAPWDDKSCMRDVLSYDVANRTGHYAVHTRYCELVLDGQYQGIYVFEEKIKRDTTRVDIAKLTPADTVGDQLTGGYIFSIDKITGGSHYWTSNYLSSDGGTIRFQYDYPKFVDMLPVQKNYIHAYMDTVENTLNSPNFADPVTGYRKYIDVPSFIDYFILNEVSKNVDGYRSSTYMNKDKGSNGGKLKMGPAWDYNIAWWNSNYCGGNTTSGWQYQFNNLCGGGMYQIPFWWTRLLSDPSYTQDLKCRWVELRQSVLSINRLNGYVDSIAAVLNEAKGRHFTIWPILGFYTWPNPSPIPGDYAGEVTALKTWIQNRIAWLDSHMPGNCSVAIRENAVSANSVTVFPNPFSTSFQLNLYLSHPDNIKMDITDMLGNTVKTISTQAFHEGDNTMEINNQDFTNGIYLLHIVSSNGSVVKKLSKQD